jgi:hypothetical protein
MDIFTNYKINSSIDLINIYDIITQNIETNPDELEIILYLNDLNNLNRYNNNLKCLTFNKKIFKIMINNNASPYIHNNEDISVIHSIIKNNNYQLLNEIKNIYKDIDNTNILELFDSKLPLKLLLDENINNINKIIPNDNTIKTVYPSNNLNSINNIILNKLLLNIDYSLSYHITSNEMYNKLNINEYIKYSFNISTYIILEYLSKYLLEINSIYTIDNLMNTLNIIDIQLNDLNNNYLIEQINNLNLNNNIDDIIIIDIINNIITKIKIIDKQIEENKNKLEQINKINNNIQKQLSNEVNKIIKELINKKEKLNKDIQNINNIKSNNILKLNKHNLSIKKENIIDIYTNLYNSKQGVLYFYIWKVLLDNNTGYYNTSKNNFNNNYNLLPLYLLEKQKDFINHKIENIEEPLSEKILELNNAFKHLSLFCETYFINEQYTDNNIILSFIDKLLIYLTKITFGTIIELFIKKTLFTYLSNDIYNNPSQLIGDKIDYILTEKLTGYNKNLIEYLYEKLCYDLVKINSKIYKNKNNIIDSSNTSKDLLLEYLNLFELTSFSLNKILENNDSIKDYFIILSQIIEKTIILWHVNIENILRYIINNHKCLETLITLIN